MALVFTVKANELEGKWQCVLFFIYLKKTWYFSIFVGRVKFSPLPANHLKGRGKVLTSECNLIGLPPNFCYYPLHSFIVTQYTVMNNNVDLVSCSDGCIQCARHKEYAFQCFILSDHLISTNLCGNKFHPEYQCKNINKGKVGKDGLQRCNYMG